MPSHRIPNGKPSAASLSALGRRDPVLGRALARLPAFPGFPDPVIRRLSSYRFLARSIVFQQLSGKAASTIHERACSLTPGPRFPTSAEVLRLPEADLRGAGLSRAKVASLNDLAERVESRRLRLAGLSRLTDAGVVEHLVQVRGIGPWTAQMFLIFRLGRLDVMPATDLGVQEGVRILDRLEHRPDPAAVQARAQPWGPLRSVASWAMWRLVEAQRGKPDFW